MKIFITTIILSICSNIFADEWINKDIVIDRDNANQFTVPLDMNLPEDDLDFKINQKECSEKMGMFFPYTLNGEDNKNICISNDSVKSSGVFLRVMVNYLSLVWAKVISTAGADLKQSRIELLVGSYCKENSKNTLCVDARLLNIENPDLEGLSLLKIRSEIMESGEAKSFVVSALDHPLISKEIAKALGGLTISSNYKELIASLALSLAYTKVPKQLKLNFSSFQVLDDSQFVSDIELELPPELVSSNLGEFSFNISEQIAKSLGVNTKANFIMNKARLLINHNCDSILSSAYGDKTVCVAANNTKLKVTLKNELITKVLKGETAVISHKQNSSSYDEFSIDFENFGFGLAKSEGASCSWREGYSFDCDTVFAIKKFFYDDKDNKFSISLSQGAKQVFADTPKGACSGVFAYSADMLKTKLNNISLEGLYPRIDFPALSKQILVDLVCYEEIEGSCHCLRNGITKPAF